MITGETMNNSSSVCGDMGYNVCRRKDEQHDFCLWRDRNIIIAGENMKNESYDCGETKT